MWLLGGSQIRQERVLVKTMAEKWDYGCGSASLLRRTRGRCRPGSEELLAFSFPVMSEALRIFSECVADAAWNRNGKHYQEGSGEMAGEGRCSWPADFH